MTGSGCVLKGFNDSNSTERIDYLLKQTRNLLNLNVGQGLAQTVHQSLLRSCALLQNIQHARAERIQ